MMTIVPAKDITNGRVNDAQVDVTNIDVIMTIPTFLMTFYDYSNDNNDFMIIIMAKIGPVVLKEIIEHCTIHTLFKYVIQQLWNLFNNRNGSQIIYFLNKEKLQQ